MNRNDSDIIIAARSRLGSPFLNHFKPDNLCDGGHTTLESCMEKGLGADDYYDCSGIVIASLCEVLKISPAHWPKEYRHAKQLALLEERSSSKAGDIAIFYQKESSSLHLGILVAKKTVIHASELAESVAEGKVRGSFSRIGIIPSEKLLDLGTEARATDTPGQL